VILDSTFLIDIEAEYGPALDKARELENGGLPLRIPMVVVYELFISVGKGANPEENRRAVERVLEGFPLVPATESIAKRAGRFEGEIQRRHGKGIGTADAIIASTAIEFDEPVMTENVRDYEKIPSDDLRIETY